MFILYASTIASHGRFDQTWEASFCPLLFWLKIDNTRATAPVRLGTFTTLPLLLLSEITSRPQLLFYWACLARIHWFICWKELTLGVFITYSTHKIWTLALHLAYFCPSNPECFHCFYQPHVHLPRGNFSIILLSLTNNELLQTRSRLKHILRHRFIGNSRQIHKTRYPNRNTSLKLLLLLHSSSDTNYLFIADLKRSRWRFFLHFQESLSQSIMPKENSPSTQILNQILLKSYSRLLPS